MSFAYEMASPASLQNLKDRAQENPITELSSYSWTSNYLATPFTGLAASVVDVGMLTADVTTPFFKEYAKSADKAVDYFSDLPSGTTKSSQDFIDSVRDSTHAASKWLTPDPRTTNFAGQAIHSFFEVMPQAIAGFVIGGPVGAAVVPGGLAANKAYQAASEEGVDTLTAVGMGAIEGATVGVGALLPATLGTSLTAGLSKVAKVGANALFGSASQAAVGIASRQSLSSLLQENGYSDLASQYRPFDRNALYADLVLGGLFGGGFSYLESRYPALIRPQNKETFKNEYDKFINELKPEDIYLASYVNDANHLEIGTLPGIPLDLPTRLGHFQAMNRAIAQIMSDDIVSIGDITFKFNFAENPGVEKIRRDINLALRENYGDISTNITSLASEVESRSVTGLESGRYVVDDLKRDESTSRELSKQNDAIYSGDNVKKPQDVVEPTNITGLASERYVVDDLKRDESPADIMSKKSTEALQGEDFEMSFKIDLAYKIANENPDMVVTSETGEAIKARDLLSIHDEDIKNATIESNAYSAAVSCLLSG